MNRDKERAIVHRLLLAFEGYAFKLWTTDHIALTNRTTDPNIIMDALQTTDVELLVLTKDMQYAGSVMLVYGNGTGVIGDYTPNLPEMLMLEVHEFAAQLE